MVRVHIWCVPVCEHDIRGFWDCRGNGAWVNAIHMGPDQSSKARLEACKGPAEISVST